MKVQVTRSFPSLGALTLVAKADMREIGLLARTRIVRRTRQGQGVDGPLAPLSPGYAKTKAQLGAVPIPDLTVSGAMLNDLDLVEVTENTVTLGWNT